MNVGFVLSLMISSASMKVPGGASECHVSHEVAQEQVHQWGLSGSRHWSVVECRNSAGISGSFLVSDVAIDDQNVCRYLGTDSLPDNENWDKTTEHYYYYYALGNGNRCPDVLSENYIQLQIVHSGDDRKELAVKVLHVLNALHGSTNDVRAALSSLPFMQRWFGANYSKLIDELNAANRQGKVRFQSLARDPKRPYYILYLDVGGEAWGLKFAYKAHSIEFREIFND